MKMKLNEAIKRIKPGEQITVEDLMKITGIRNRNTVIKALSRAYQSGIIKKVDRYSKNNENKQRIYKGYYKPKEVVNLEIIMPKDISAKQIYLEKNGQIIGIYSGSFLFNKWGLSQQVPSKREFITNQVKSKNYQIEGLNIKVKTSPIKINNYNYKSVELIEILKTYKKAVSPSNEKQQLEIIANYVKRNYSLVDMYKFMYVLFSPPYRKYYKLFQKLTTYLPFESVDLYNQYLKEKGNEIT